MQLAQLVETSVVGGKVVAAIRGNLTLRDGEFSLEQGFPTSLRKKNFRKKSLETHSRERRVEGVDDKPTDSMMVDNMEGAEISVPDGDVKEEKMETGILKKGEVDLAIEVRVESSGRRIFGVSDWRKTFAALVDEVCFAMSTFGCRACADCWVLSVSYKLKILRWSKAAATL